MKNDIKEQYGSLAGRYEISCNVNKKPSYKMGGVAIWYNELDSWMIGPTDKLGSKDGFIHTIDDFGGLKDDRNIWKYWNGHEWKTAGTNDITVEWMSGNSKFL